MSAIQKVLVGLDLSDIDLQLIKYTSFFAELIGVEKVYFVHNIKRYEISEMLEKEMKDIDLEQIITDEINETVSGHFTAKVDWEVLISDDPYTESLMSYVVNKYNIDLLILGNKNDKSGSGVLGFKLLRTIKCQFLWVPNQFDIQLNKIWVGIDFSNVSKKSFSFTKLIQSRNNAQVEAVHVYSLPVHFSPYLNNSKIQPKVDEYVDKKFDNFLKKINPNHDITPVKILGREANIAIKLKKEAYKNDVDLLVVSDKGANTFSNLTLGSVTEDLFNKDLKIPLLVVKHHINE